MKGTGKGEEEREPRRSYHRKDRIFFADKKK